ncbi:hypothetical protein U0035_02260 [Niabella yanshanensis]|uniref:Uncharacterized protein n=1 Tax=Niabella yanshanensis TaxID=577386 RepID=A0ABZ0W8P0_9BACT|nr:hypothetical protein [Niabella yanshanensis]WQD38968.1 hypothetical protein U0035_02260 [Niabella yanshanensis]
MYANNHQDAGSLALLQLTRKLNRWVEEEGRRGDYVKPSGKKPASFLFHLLLMLNIIYCYENISSQTT